MVQHFPFFLFNENNSLKKEKSSCAHVFFKDIHHIGVLQNLVTQNMTQKLGQLLINEYMTHWRIDLTLLKALLTSKPSTNARNINSGTETIWYHCVLCPVQCRSLSMTKAGCNCAFRVLHQPIDLAINFLNWTIIHSTFNMDWVNPL